MGWGPAQWPHEDYTQNSLQPCSRLAFIGAAATDRPPTTLYVAFFLTAVHDRHYWRWSWHKYDGWASNLVLQRKSFGRGEDEVLWQYITSKGMLLRQGGNLHRPTKHMANQTAMRFIGSYCWYLVLLCRLLSAQFLVRDPWSRAGPNHGHADFQQAAARQFMILQSLNY
jgi:hypothetical protein